MQGAAPCKPKERAAWDAFSVEFEVANYEDLTLR